MNKRTLLIVLVIAAIVFSFCPALIAQTSTYTTTEGQDDAWIEDMEGKVSATIKVLSIIQNELEEEKKTREEPVDESPDAWADSLRKNIQRIKRIWAEVQKMKEEELKKSGTVSESKEDTEQWTREMSEKLEKSIKAMQVIKEELDEMEKEKN